MSNTNDSNLIVSYLALRRLIGAFGFALPIAILLYVLISHAPDLEASISAYYHTTFRDILVGVLCAVGVFMLAYKGYETIDTVLSIIAGISAIGVAMFPTSDLAMYGMNVPAITPLVGTIHVLATGVLFLTFAAMSFFLFTKSGPTQTAQKKKRNWLYRICAIVIVLCIGTMIVHTVLAAPNPAGWRPTFWFETISLFAFGLSWLVKGETILRD